MYSYTDKRAMKVDKISWLIFLSILFLGFALKIKFLFQVSLWPDEALYLYIARNLAVDVTNLTDISGKMMYESPPLLMYLLSFAADIKFIEFDQAARAMIVLMGMGTVLTTYLIGRKLYHPLVGIIAALLLAICPLSNWVGIRILTDIPVVFFIYLAIYMLVNEKKPVFYLFGLCAVLTKYSAFPILFIPFFMKLKPRVWATLYLTGFVTLLAFVMSKNLFPKLDGWVGYFYNFFQLPNVFHMAREIDFFLGYLLAGFILIGIFLTIREQKYSAVFHWFVVFGISRIFLPWIVFRVSRYTLPLYPALYIFAAYGCYRGAQLLKLSWPSYSKLVNVSLVLLIAGIVFFNAQKSLGIMNQTSNSFSGYAQACAFLIKQPSPHSIVTASPRQIKYFAPEFNVHDIDQRITPDEFRIFIEKEKIEYLSIDSWSPHLPSWCNSFDFQEKGYDLIFNGQDVRIFKVPKR
ncbi:glycosyltransferase family 39 protein [uncultured Desulfobulbus sp.]|uniref:ArnT family glycosyltransferase n=1 Tax=uncultured Desulfobulbus sp. TaxID=239745 RepID=UPI0029C90CD7|nr:glycosyltransferase family 39 protein [uncultured Desulfobulbus sp.]